MVHVPVDASPTGKDAKNLCFDVERHEQFVEEKG